ncbi:recombinase family protein [Amycolatopsis methanolica]|uniref:recombinase family protein n=1 Tax=Amycolatopsis methanolica TaxID=1814 RepID=UPI003434BE67
MSINADRPLRALIVLRLSRTTDLTASIDTQRRRCQQYCQAYGWTVVGEAVDENVSGAKSPFERPGFSRWLRDTPPKPYDVVVAFHLSRITRSALDALSLLTWLKERKRELVTVDDGINTATTFGKTYMTVIAALAEAEREATQVRLLEMKETKRQQGYVTGGNGSWPYDLVRVENGKRLKQNANAPLLLDAIDRIITGEPVASVCAQWQIRGIPAPGNGDYWHTSTLMRILRNPILCGYSVTNGEINRDDKGAPIMITDEPILTRTKFDTLQDVLDERTQRLSRPRKGSPLADIVKCAECGEGRITNGGKARRSLMCNTPGCNGGGILERIVYEAIDERLHEQFPTDVDLYEWELPQRERDIDERLEHLRSREAELQETIRMNALDRAKWDKQGLTDVYQSILDEQAQELSDVRAEMQTLESEAATEHQPVKVMLDKSLYEVWPDTYEKLRDESDGQDIRFALAFAGIRVSVTKIERKGQGVDARKRIKFGSNEWAGVDLTPSA